MNNIKTYSIECPVCHTICTSLEGCNAFCKCNAKYYVRDKMWLDRNTGREYKYNSQGNLIEVTNHE